MEQYELPHWVRKRDSRRVPFEADKISQALFAATEAQGRPDAFLARELADGVLHFLAQEAAGADPTTEQIADLVVKVTRELGYPELAQAFLRPQQQGPLTPVRKTRDHLALALSPEDRSGTVARRARLLFERKAVYTRDLAAAMREGLLRGALRGRPEAIDSLVLEPGPVGAPWGQAVLEQMVQLRPEVRKTFILDSPEHRLGPDPESAAAWVRQLSLLLQALNRSAVLNLYCAEPPVWARAVPIGPLFQNQGMEAPLGDPAAITRIILSELGRRPRGWRRVAVDWHINSTGSLSEGELNGLIGQGVISCCTLDRPTQPLHLAEGLDRAHSAALMKVGLDLPRFLALPALEGKVDRFLEKLPSLVGMAVSAGVQRRAYLTRRLPRRSFLSQGFLVHRARLLLMPLGLEEMVRQVLGQAPTEGKEAQELARRVVQALVQGAQAHGRRRNLETAVVLRLTSQPLRLESLIALADQLQAAGASVTLKVPHSGPEWSSLTGKMGQKNRLARFHFAGRRSPIV